MVVEVMDTDTDMDTNTVVVVGVAAAAVVARLTSARTLVNQLIHVKMLPLFLRNAKK